MQTQQLKYLIAAADHGSFRAAAQSLYVSQSSISVAIKDLEQELGVPIFERTSRGTSITPEGAEIVDRARSIVEQLDAMEKLYMHQSKPKDAERFAVSSQHYTLVVDAFAEFVNERMAQGCESCAFSLLESYTNEIIRDVQENRSMLGIIYLSNYNDRAITRSLSSAGLCFTSLYVAQPHAIVRSEHPLALRERLSTSDLEPYPRFEQEQGYESSSYFAEEPLAALPCDRRLIVSDNSTLSTLLTSTDGYALGTGAFPDEGSRFAAIPIETDEVMNIGFIACNNSHTNPHTSRFLVLLARRIMAFEGPIEPSSFTIETASRGK